MKIHGSLLGAALCLVPLALTTTAHSAELALPKDGWASWQVDAVEGAPAWCCWSSWERDAPRTACDLDDYRGNHGNRGDDETDSIRVYARFAGGKVERVRALAASCPANAKTPIQDLGTVATDDSARWLAVLVKDATESGHHGDMRDNVMAALALHRGNFTQNTLTSMARGDAAFERRKSAVFWLAMMRGEPGARVATDVMFKDTNPGMREHATFAVSQSKSLTKAQDLTRLGNTDDNADVRAKAWFWLAHTGAPKAEESIGAAIRNDRSEHVREHAVFALSQLRGERAVAALISVAEDKSLDREQRKRALFWLGQSRDAAAQNYLDKVLTGNLAR